MPVVACAARVTITAAHSRAHTATIYSDRATNRIGSPCGETTCAMSQSRPSIAHIHQQFATEENRMRIVTRWLAVPAAVLTLALAACGGGGAATPQPSATGPIAGADCADEVSGGRQVTFGSEGKADLYGVVFGTGTKGLVLGHQNGGSVCQWSYNAKQWAAQGYRVLAFDFSGFGASLGSQSDLVQNMTAATAFLRADGATSIVLIGASMGGTAAIAAGTVITPPVNGVVAISAPTSFGGVHADEAAGKLTVPVLYMAGEIESSFAANAQKMHDLSTKSPSRAVLIAPGAANHGVFLVMVGGSTEAQEALATFLKSV
jgi:dienelactone hydrolase